MTAVQAVEKGARHGSRTPSSSYRGTPSPSQSHKSLKKRGHSANGRGFLGLLFGPLALVGVLLVNPEYAALEQADAQTGLVWRSPRCDELIRKAATLCRNCGAEIQN